MKPCQRAASVRLPVPLKSPLTAMWTRYTHGRRFRYLLERPTPFGPSGDCERGQVTPCRSAGGKPHSCGRPMPAIVQPMPYPISTAAIVPRRRRWIGTKFGEETWRARVLLTTLWPSEPAWRNYGASGRRRRARIRLSPRTKPTFTLAAEAQPKSRIRRCSAPSHAGGFRDDATPESRDGTRTGPAASALIGL